MAIIKKSMQIINAKEGVEKREPSYAIGGNVNLFSHYRKQYGYSLKKNGGTTWSSNPTPGHLSGKDNNCHQKVYVPNILSNTIHDSQAMETT